MSQYTYNDHKTELACGDSIVNYSQKENSLLAEQRNNGVNSDSQDDVRIKSYHRLLLDSYAQVQSNEFNHSEQLNLKEYFNDSVEKASTKSVKVLFSCKSAKIFSADQSKSIKSLKTMNSCEEPMRQLKQYDKDKRKYMKQEAKRIKKQLKEQLLQEKRENRQFRYLDIDFEQGTRGKGSSLSKRKRRLTKKTLELLSAKFDDYYARENNLDYKGPRMTIREIGQLFDMGNSTVHKLYAEWIQDPSFYERITRENLKQKAPQRKIILQRLQHIARLIKENPFLTQNELTVQLNKIQDLKYVKNGARIEINRTTVARLLKVGKFKKKRVKCVPKQRNTAKSVEKRHHYCVKYKDICMKNAKVYFLDESGFNLYMTRDKAWARPNQEITVNCPIAKGKRFSLIAIISEEGLTHWRIIEGTYRKYQYLDFLKQLFLRIKQQADELTEQQRNQEQNMRQKWLILDNCAIHDKEQTINMAKSCGMQILFLPPYSPQLNPIQNWFNQVKAKIRKINYSGEKQLLDIMHRTLKEYEDHDFTNYYKGALKHVEKGINNERF